MLIVYKLVLHVSEEKRKHLNFVFLILFPHNKWQKIFYFFCKNKVLIILVMQNLVIPFLIINIVKKRTFSFITKSLTFFNGYFPFFVVISFYTYPKNIAPIVAELNNSEIKLNSASRPFQALKLE